MSEEYESSSSPSSAAEASGLPTLFFFPRANTDTFMAWQQPDAQNPFTSDQLQVLDDAQARLKAAESSAAQTKGASPNFATVLPKAEVALRLPGTDRREMKRKREEDGEVDYGD